MVAENGEGLLLSPGSLAPRPQPLAPSPVSTTDHGGLATSVLANPPPRYLLLFSLYRRQDLIDLPAGGLTDRGGFRARVPLWERRIRSQILKLFVPDQEDGSDSCHLIFRQV